MENGTMALSFQVLALNTPHPWILLRDSTTSVKIEISALEAETLRKA